MESQGNRLKTSREVNLNFLRKKNIIVKWGPRYSFIKRRINKDSNQK